MKFGAVKYHMDKYKFYFNHYFVHKAFKYGNVQNFEAVIGQMLNHSV
jgi:hypothetical protein